MDALCPLFNKTSSLPIQKNKKKNHMDALLGFQKSL